MSNTPRFSPSLAKVLLTEGTEAAWAEATRDRSVERKRTPSMRIGDAVDNIVFNQGKTVVIRSKRGQEEKRGEILLNTEQYRRAQAMAKAVDGQFPDTGWAQSKLIWTADGVVCSSKPDWHDDDHVKDLKTTWNTERSYIEWTIQRLCYDVQAAAYQEATGTKGVTFVFVNSKAPFVVVVYEMSGEQLATGRDKWVAARARWKDLLLSNRHWIPEPVRPDFWDLYEMKGKSNVSE